MNIVILTSFLPYPLQSGGAQAQYNMIDRLRGKHQFTLVFPESRKNSLKDMRRLQTLWPDVEFRPYSFCKQLLQPSFLCAKAKRAWDIMCRSGSDRFLVERTLKPYGFPSDARFVKFLHQVICEQQAELVQVDFYPFLHMVRQLPLGIPCLFIHHELRFIRNERLLNGIALTDGEKHLMEVVKQQELADLNACDAIVTLTDVDRGILQAEGVQSPVYVSPAAINSPILPYADWNKRIVFVGGKGHTPNKEGLDWFFSNVLPLVDWEQSGCEGLDVIGTGWSEADVSGRELHGLLVRFHGFVPDLADVAQGAILIVPILSGSGMRMKILEGAALSLPMLTTTVGVEGLLFSSPGSLLLADTPEAFAASLVSLMQGADLRKRLTDQARRIFEKHYSAEALALVRDEVYAHFAKKRTSE